MSLFEKDWISSRWVDFELKKYTLLSYLQRVDKKFSQRKVYPYLLMLKDQFSDVQQIQQSLLSLNNPLYSSDATSRKQTETRRGEMETILNIADFALPKLRRFVDEGNEIEAYVTKSVEIYPVGVVPFENREGYLIFKYNQINRVYQYELRLVKPSSDDDIHSAHLKTWFIQDECLSRFRTLQSLKQDLIKSRKELPNPATYAVESTFALPYPETLVPIGRKLLYELIK